MYKRNNWVYDSEEIYNDFIKNVGKFKNLVIIKNDSIEAAKLVTEDEIDLVFIDGNHDYEFVKKDILTWLPRTTKLICGHDWNLFPGVNQAVK